MVRWLIFSVLTTGLLLTPLSAQDAAPKAKSKAEPKAAPPKAKSEATKLKTDAPKAETIKPKPAPDEKTVKEQASYAIGMNFGKNLARGIKQDGADVDLEILMQGIKDALTQAKPAYTEEELSTAIEIFGKELEIKAQARRKDAVEKDKAVAAANKKEAETFLAENKKKKDVQTTATGLQYKVIKKGDGKAPQKTDGVRVHYHGTLIDGTVFDSSKDRGKPIEFAVTGVIKGWTEALLKMKEGDKWMLYIPSDLAYGPERQSEEIGPNQLLIFEVELLAVLEGK
jgi:FKBP-type peptidyl-prolyl cis-trans isomerase FklB